MKTTIKSKKKENSGVAPLMKNGPVHSDSHAKADILNMQFLALEMRATFRVCAFNLDRAFFFITAADIDSQRELYMTDLYLFEPSQEHKTCLFHCLTLT